MERHTLTHLGIYSVNASALCSLLIGSDAPARMRGHGRDGAGETVFASGSATSSISKFRRLIRHLPLIVKIHNTLFACIFVWESIMQAGAIAQSC
jgi:hypothetical protein